MYFQIKNNDSTMTIFICSLQLSSFLQIFQLLRKAVKEFIRNFLAVKGLHISGYRNLKLPLNR